MNPLLAAATHTGGGTGLLVVAGLGWAAVHLISCIIWPFRACRKCQGAGRFRSPSGRAWRYCTTCRGRGAQLRAGRRIWTWLKDQSPDRDRRNH